MDNEILQIDVQDISLVPAEAEVGIVVRPRFLTPGTELRGRLMGPRCLYASTIEVAYPLRSPPPRPRQQPPPAGTLAPRVVIPEASLWDLQSPFLYEGPVELWQDGRRTDRKTIRHGLRGLTLTSAGVRLNGKPLHLHGRVVRAGEEEAGHEFRKGGGNLLVVPVEPAAVPLWALADEVGLLVLGRLDRQDTEAIELAAELTAHPSHLGWLLPEPNAALLQRLRHLPRRGILGVCLDTPPDDGCLAPDLFVVGAWDQLAVLKVPVLVCDKAQVSAGPGVLGWLEPADA